MKLLMRQSYILPNMGGAHEFNLAILSMIFISRKIENNLPVPLPEKVTNLVECFQDHFKDPFVEVVKELWNIADGLGLQYPRVRAEVHIFTRQYKIVFHCYGD